LKDEKTLSSLKELIGNSIVKDKSLFSFLVGATKEQKKLLIYKCIMKIRLQPINRIVTAGITAQSLLRDLIEEGGCDLDVGLGYPKDAKVFEG